MLDSFVTATIVSVAAGVEPDNKHRTSTRLITRLAINRGRENEWFPLPPNRTCGSPASGSPVGGSPREGLMRVQGRQREHSVHFNEHQHPFRPERRVNRRHSSSLSPIRHWRWPCRHRSALVESTFLRSLRSTPVTELHRYYGRSDSCLLRLFGTRSMNSDSFSKQVSLIHASGLADHSVSNHLTHPRCHFVTLPLSATGFPTPLGSGLRLSHAGSSTAPGRIEFVILRHALTHGLALNKLSRDEIHRVDLRDLVNRDDVGMVECRDSFRFLPKAPHAILIGGEINRENLERDFAIQSRVLRQIDFAHPARTQRGKHFVWTKSRTFSDRHIACFRGGIPSGPMRRAPFYLHSIREPRPRTCAGEADVAGFYSSSRRRRILSSSLSLRQSLNGCLTYAHC